MTGSDVWWNVAAPFGASADDAQLIRNAELLERSFPELADDAGTARATVESALATARALGHEQLALHPTFVALIATARRAGWRGWNAKVAEAESAGQ